MIGIDDRYFPLVVQDWSGEHSDAELADYCRRQEELLRRSIREHVKMIQLSFGGESLSVAHRKILTEWIHGLPEGWQGQSLAVLVVVRSTAARGALTALQWVVPKLRGMTFISDSEEGVRRACAIFSDARVPIPRGIERLMQSA